MRSGHVGDRGKQGVLHDRPQQDVGAERRRLLANEIAERVRGQQGVAQGEGAVAQANGPAPPVQVEQRDRVVGRLHLRVVAARRQLRPGRRRQPRRFAAQSQLAVEDRPGERLGRGIGRIEHDQAAVAEHAVEPPAERLDQPGPGCIRRGEALENRRGELRGRQGFPELIEQRADGLRQAYGRARPPGLRGEVERDPVQLEVVVEDLAGADLVEVVVLGVHPEDRHRDHPVLGLHAPCEGDGGERLEQRVERPAEQSGLLAGEDRDRAGRPKTLRGGQCRRGRPASLQLPGQDVGDSRRAAACRLPRLDGLAPASGRAGRARIELLEAIEGVAVVARERCGPRQLPKIDGGIERCRRGRRRFGRHVPRTLSDGLGAVKTRGRAL